jgi:hypothetical protein
MDVEMGLQEQRWWLPIYATAPIGGCCGIIYQLRRLFLNEFNILVPKGQDNRGLVPKSWARWARRTRQARGDRLVEAR